ncbi:MAG: alpha/beta hydrolase [Acidobacteriaceae bacterium]
MATITTTAPQRATEISHVFPIWKTVGAVLAFVLIAVLIVLGSLFYFNPLRVIDEGLHARLALAGIHSEFVTVGPYRVHYFVGGQGQPLLLIHGLGSRSEDWAPEMPEYVKQGFRVYAIDLLGCGRTDHPDIAYTVQQQADLVHGFLDAVHVQRADVAGWSMGGWVALRFALEHPERVRRLVAMDSAGLLFPTTLTPEIFEPRTIPQLKKLEVLLVPDPPSLPAFFNRALLRAMQRNFFVVHRTVQSMLTENDLLDGRLGELHMPVLLVWGAQDALIPSKVGVRMHQAIPKSVLQIYSGCGHIGPATCASRMVPRVVDFLHSDAPVTGGIRHY